MLSEFKFLPSWENVPKFVQPLFSRTTDIPIKTSVHTYIKTVVSLLWLRFCLSYQNLLPYRSRWVSREKYSVSYSVIICLMLLPECFRRLRITRSCRTVTLGLSKYMLASSKPRQPEEQLNTTYCASAVRLRGTGELRTPEAQSERGGLGTESWRGCEKAGAG